MINGESTLCIRHASKAVPHDGSMLAGGVVQGVIHNVEEAQFVSNTDRGLSGREKERGVGRIQRKTVFLFPFGYLRTGV